MKYFWGIMWLGWSALWIHAFFFDGDATQGVKLGLLALMLITGHLAVDGKRSKK